MALKQKQTILTSLGFITFQNIISNGVFVEKLSAWQ